MDTCASWWCTLIWLRTSARVCAWPLQMSPTIRIDTRFVAQWDLICYFEQWSLLRVNKKQLKIKAKICFTKKSLPTKNNGLFVCLAKETNVIGGDILFVLRCVALLSMGLFALELAAIGHFGRLHKNVLQDISELHTQTQTVKLKLESQANLSEQTRSRSEFPNPNLNLKPNSS